MADHEGSIVVEELKRVEEEIAEFGYDVVDVSQTECGEVLRGIVIAN